jgi:hypothetical protein
VAHLEARRAPLPPPRRAYLWYEKSKVNFFSCPSSGFVMYVDCVDFSMRMQHLAFIPFSRELNGRTRTATLTLSAILRSAAAHARGGRLASGARRETVPLPQAPRRGGHARRTGGRGVRVGERKGGVGGRAVREEWTQWKEKSGARKCRLGRSGATHMKPPTARAGFLR